MATQLEDDYTEDAPELDLDDADEGTDDQGEDDDSEGDESEQPEDEHDVITFGSDAVAGEDEPEGMRNLRNRLKELERENRTLKAPAKQEEIGPRPRLDDFGYDEEAEERHADAVAEWLDRKRAADTAKTVQEEAARKQQERWDAQARELNTGYGELKAPGKDAARATVEDQFPGEQFAYLVKAAGKNAPGFIFALGNSSEKREELRTLAADGSWAEFIAAAAVMAKEVNVERRKPMTQPDTNHAARGSSGGSGGGDQRRARLEREADKSGDYSELVKYDRKVREMKRG